MNADRNLLFGIMALQMDFITREQLVAAMNAWVLEKKTPLAQILLKQNALTKELHTLLDALVNQHLKQHGGDAEKSLAAINSVRLVPDELNRIGDPDVATSLLRVAAPVNRDIWATQAVSVGAATSGGLRFRILRPHAKGGLGEVFVAKDEELRREVALKHMQNQHADNPDSRSRFMLEAEITGGLEHPGIVPVYGLGAYDDGRPYYAMRFIRGDSLKDAIDRFHKNPKPDMSDRALDLRSLLGRFIDVCNAIEYAHSRGVIHRDLKPGNIMLGKYGETLVVDWGLAKAIGQSEPSFSRCRISEEGSLTPSLGTASAATQMGSALGTPQYMSPEQASGRLDLQGPQTDVYSLGATLYCLLTGEPPLSEASHDLGELLRRVQRGDIRPPRALKPDIPRALEAVCLKAMAVEFDKRYPSPKGLADDLEHWLANEPVSARQESFVERASRWARRHRTWIRAGLTMLLAVVAVSLIFSTLLYRARNRAEESFLQARSTVDQYFTDVSENKLLDVPALQPLREELLNSALTYYEGFVQQRADDASVRNELAKTHYRIGLIVGKLRSKSQALESLQKARSIQEEMITSDSASPELAADLANTHNAIGELKLQTGEDAAAMAEFETARSMREELANSDPRDGQLRRKLANSYNNLAVMAARLGDRAKADKNYDRANELRKQLTAENPKSAQFSSDLARGYYNFGLFKRENGEWNAALELFGLAARIYENLSKQEPKSIEYRRELAITHRIIGDVQTELGKFEAAEESYTQARALAESLAKKNPFLLELRADVAAICTSLGQLKKLTDKVDDALRYFNEAQAIQEGLVEDDDTVTRYRRDLAASKIQSGIIYLNRDEFAQAKGQFESSLQIYSDLAKSNPDDATLKTAIAQIHVDIGLVHRGQDDHEAALASFRETAKIYEKMIEGLKGLEEQGVRDEAAAGLADALLNVAVELRALQRVEEALAELDKAHNIESQLVQRYPAVPKYRQGQTEIDYLVGLIRAERAELDAAAAIYQRVKEQRERLVKDLPENPYYKNLLGVALDELAVVLWRKDDKEQALATSRQATEYLENALAKAPRLTEYRGNLRAHYRHRAYFEREMGHFSEAARLSIEAKKISSQNGAALYDVAVDLAATVKAAANDSSVPKAESAAWLEQAVDAIEEAVKAGEDVASLKDDANLQPLYDHPRFKALTSKKD